MKPSVVLSSERNRETNRRVVQSNRGLNPRVFGSVLDGTDEDGSDLDLLIDPAPGMTPLDLCGMDVELTDLLGIPTDVNAPRYLPEAFRDEVAIHARAI